jgi:hypothetical protein
MRRQRQIQKQYRARRRDDDLRAAHQRAWAQIEAARDRVDQRDAVTRAVQELIEACAAFVEAGAAAGSVAEAS